MFKTVYAAEPLVTSSIQLIIFMLFLLQLATCRNDTYPKRSCQKFWALHLHGLSLTACQPHNSVRKRVFWGLIWRGAEEWALRVSSSRLASGEAWLQRPADTPPVDSSPVEVCIQADWQIIEGPNKSWGSRRGFCAEQFAYTRSELVFQADSVAWAGSPGAAKRSRFVWLLSLQSGLPSSADRLSSKPRIHSRIFTRNTSSFGRGGERADSRLTVRGQCFSCSTQVGF